MQICTSPRQIMMPTSHHSVFTGWMSLLPPNQQRYIFIMYSLWYWEYLCISPYQQLHYIVILLCYTEISGFCKSCKSNQKIYLFHFKLDIGVLLALSANITLFDSFKESVWSVIGLCYAVWQLLSPDDLVKACQFMEYLKLPVRYVVHCTVCWNLISMALIV